jgi:hypothetical protein
MTEANHSLQSRLTAGLHFGLALSALMLLTTLLSRPTADAVTWGQSLGLSALGVHAALMVAMTTLTFLATGCARAILFKRKGLLPQLVYGLVGAPIGFVYAFGFDAFAALGSLARGAGAYELVVLGLSAGFVVIGAMAAVGTALSQMGAGDIAMSRRDRVMTAPAAGVWVLEGIGLTLLTMLHLRSQEAPDALAFTLFGLLALCVVLDAIFQILTWRAMDEFMRRAWAEAMALGLVAALAIGVLYAGVQSLGLMPEAGLYHALTATYGIYVLISVIHTAVRMPEVFKTGAMGGLS